MKSSLEQLPSGYEPAFSVNLQKDKKLAVLVNLIALALAAVMAIPMHFHIPIQTLFDLSEGLSLYLIRFGTLLLALFAYIVLHEAVHGITMKLFGCHRVKFGFTGLYAYAGTEEYLFKWPYLVVALAPVILWGAVFAILCCVIPTSWFWWVYILQIMNISGAAGDLYVTIRFLRLPRNILVQDQGVSMTVFRPSDTE